MKVTNNLNLPQPIVDAVTNDTYSKGDGEVSVTELLQPPRITVLRKQYEDQIEEDASDRIWSLLGQSIHTILERSDDGSELSEQRFTAIIDGVILSGKFDRFVVTKGIVQDYKITTAYKFKNGEVPKDFQQQLNAYAYLLRLQGYDVKSGEIVGILRDWSKLEAKRDPEYPQKNVITLPVQIYENAKIEEFLRKKIAAYKAAKVTLPECSDEDRWAKAPKYAVMKKGAARAVRLLDTQDDADKRVQKEGSGHYVQFRPGEQVRCENYCPVKEFCDQAKKLGVK